MRVLILIGSFLLILGSFVFTRGSSWHFGYMIPGGFIALAGFVVLALAASATRSPASVTSSRTRRRALASRPAAAKLRRVAVSG